MPVLIAAAVFSLVVFILMGLWPSDKHGGTSRKVLSTTGRGLSATGGFLYDTARYVLEKKNRRPKRKLRKQKQQPQPKEPVVRDLFMFSDDELPIYYHDTGKWRLGDITEDGKFVGFLFLPRVLEDGKLWLVAYSPFIVEESEDEDIKYMLL